MIKSIKTWILVGFASLLLVACGQGGGGAGSKKSKTLDNNNSTLKMPPEGYILPKPKPNE